jgi:uncharacterized protein involved in tolerance to divalent cations
MVNITLYLSTETDAEQIALGLLKEKLVAHASIAEDNNSYVFDGEIKKERNYVVTAQTKSLLFSAIEDYIKQNCSEDIRIFSMPITQCNKAFYDYILEHAVQV